MPIQGAIHFSSTCSPYTWEPEGGGGKWELFDDESKFCVEIQEFEPKGDEGDDAAQFWIMVIELDKDGTPSKTVASIPIDLSVVNPRFYSDRSAAVFSITPRVDDQPSAVYLFTFPAPAQAAKFEEQFCHAVQIATAIDDTEREVLRTLVAPQEGPANGTYEQDEEFLELFEEANAAEPAAEKDKEALAATAPSRLSSKSRMAIDEWKLDGPCLREIPEGEVGSVCYIAPHQRVLTAAGASLVVAGHRGGEAFPLEVPAVQKMEFAPHHGVVRMHSDASVAALCPQSTLTITKGIGGAPPMGGSVKYGRGVVALYDVDRGSVGEYLEGLGGDGVTGEDGAEIADVATAYEGGGPVPVVGVGKGWINGWDPRVGGSRSVVVNATKMTMDYRSGHKFLCCALTVDGHVVAGTSTGIIVFHRGVPGVGKNPKKAMTALKLFSGVPIIGLDVTPCGRWVLASTRVAVVLVKCFELDGAPSKDDTCFTHRTKADILGRRGRLWTLTLRPDDFGVTGGRPFQRATFSSEAAGGQLMRCETDGSDAPDVRPVAMSCSLPNGWPRYVAVPVGECVVQWSVADVVYGGLAGLYKYQIVRVGGVERKRGPHRGLKAATFARGNEVPDTALVVAGDGVVGVVPRRAASRAETYEASGRGDLMRWP